MADWRKTRWAAGLIIGVFLVVQLALPLARLGADDPTRFGWQMYSTPRPLAEFVVVTESGETPVVLEDHTAAMRVELDFVALMPPHLCSVTPGAVRVTWDEGEYTC